MATTECRGHCLCLFERCCNKTVKQRVGAVGAAFEFGMELAADEERMFRQFDQLNEPAVGRLPGQTKPGCCERMTVVVAELIAVAVTLRNLLRTVEHGSARIRRKHTAVRTQPHCAALCGDALLIGHERDNGVWSPGRKLCRVGILETGSMTGKFDNRNLHAQTNAKIGQSVFTRILRSQDHTLNAASAKAAPERQNSLQMPAGYFAA